MVDPLTSDKILDGLPVARVDTDSLDGSGWIRVAYPDGDGVNLPNIYARMAMARWLREAANLLEHGKPT